MFLTANSVFSATEFICTIKAAGGDYNNLKDWENAVDSDLTDSRNVVFSGTLTGTMADGANITGSISGAGGSVYHVTATQIYVWANSGTFVSGENIQVDGSNYFTTSNAGDSPIAVAECYAVNDTNGLSISGWGVTAGGTSATNYIVIRATSTGRHAGIWDDAKYRISAGTSTDVINTGESNVRIDGVQIYLSKDDAVDGNGIQIYGDTGGAQDIRISNCIIKGPGNFANITKKGIFGANTAVAGSTARIWNNIIYDITGAGASGYFGIYIRNANRTCYLYNNTIVNCKNYGIYRDLATGTAKNNITQDCADGYAPSSGWSAETSNNLSDVASDAIGTNPVTAIVSFVDKSGKNFHLASSVGGARDAGTNLSTDTYISFLTDIDGNNRPSSWDIGADECMTAASGAILSGFVLNGATGVSGVTVSLTGSETGSFVTGSNGAYSFVASTGVGQNYTLTPTLTNWSFSPVSIVTNGFVSDTTSQFDLSSYTGSYVSISGTVRTSTGTVIGGVSLALSASLPGSSTSTVTTSNASGAYTFNNLYVITASSYTITPSKTGWVFGPVSISSTSGSNITGADVTGTKLDINSTPAEFVCKIKATGGDYTRLYDWEAAIDSDLTSSNNLVFSGVKTGTINDGASVTGATSGATGTVYHCTDTQIYLAVVSGSFQSGEQAQVDGSNYFTIAGLGSMVIAVAECYGMTDTKPVTIGSWGAAGAGTSASNYILIRTSGTGSHTGKWTSTAYILDVGTSTDALYFDEANVRVEGVQINISKNDGGTGNGITVDGDTTVEDMRISNCIFRGTGAFSTGTIRGIFGAKTATTGMSNTLRVWNNLFYDITGPIGNSLAMFLRDADRTAYVYNNTIVNCWYGMYQDDSTIFVAKNNLIQDCTNGFVGTFDATSDYNLSDIASDAPGTTNFTGDVTFLDIAGKDFHLTSADTVARDIGFDLSADSYLAFSTDFEGNPRGTWDIGSDEYYVVSGDSTPPNAPTNLVCGTKTETSLALSWTASTAALDGDFASYYRLYRGAVLTTSTIMTSFIDTGLTAYTTYVYTVYAVDDADNASTTGATGSYQTLVDTTPPTINTTTALSSTSVRVVFSESVTQASAETAANYSISGGIAISAASLGGDLVTVTLTTAQLTEGTTYTLTINNVADRSPSPNTIAANSTKTFTYVQDAIPPYIISFSPSDKATGVYADVTIKVVFSEEMDQATLNCITVTDIRDKDGAVTSTLVSGTTSYNTSTSELTLTPASAVGYNHKFRVAVAATARDLAGNLLAAATNFTFETIANYSESNTVISGNQKVKVEIAAGATGTDYYSMKISTDPANAPDEVTPADITTANGKLTSTYQLTNILCEINLYDNSGSQLSGGLAGDAYVTMTYPDANNDGIVDGTAASVKESNLKIYYLNEAAQVWEEVTGSVVDTTANTVRVKVAHFSVFALIGTEGSASSDLKNAHAFPVPFKPSLGHTVITFSNLTAAAKIKIYTISGELIIELEETGNDGKYEWDAKTKEGKLLASGVYIYYIYDDSGYKTGKFMVVK